MTILWKIAYVVNYYSDDCYFLDQNLTPELAHE